MRYSAPAQKCPIVILLSDSPDNGLIGQWGDWLRKSQININTNILSIPAWSRDTELVGEPDCVHVIG